MDQRPSLSIVIPAFNEATRLPKTLQSLREYAGTDQFHWNLKTVTIVDDGSSDSTVSICESWQAQWSAVELVRLTSNCGKGAAVREGLKACTGESDWILIADADESTPWSEISSLGPLCQQPAAPFMVFGSRAHQDSRIEIKQPWYREKMGKVFNWTLRQISGISFRDTQCGFKAFNNDENLKEFISKLSVDRFAWDVEVFMNAKHRGLTVLEMPVRWRHMDESRVNPIKDSFEMLKTIILLRLRLVFASQRISKSIF